jgi:hypothetical protein
MPSYGLLDCVIELGNSNLRLREYGTRYHDRTVETYVAIPNQPTPFSICLNAHGYIAPGLSLFVYIDGIYQTNRNKRGLLPPTAETPDSGDIEFRLGNKEDILKDGRVIAREWWFEKLNIGKLSFPALLTSHQLLNLSPVASRSKSTANKTILDNLGTIEVVVLRCQEDPAVKPRKDPYDFPRFPKADGTGKASSPTSKYHETNDHGGDDDNGIFSLFDGAADERPQVGFSLDGQEESNSSYSYNLRSPMPRTSSRHPSYSYVTSREFDVPECMDIKSSSDEEIVAAKRPSYHHAQQSAAPAYFDEHPHYFQSAQSGHDVRRHISPRGSPSNNVSHYKSQPHSTHHGDPRFSTYYSTAWETKRNENALREQISPRKQVWSYQQPIRERVPNDNLKLEELRYCRVLEERKLEECKLETRRISDQHRVEKHREEARALQKEIHDLKRVKRPFHFSSRGSTQDRAHYVVLPNRREGSDMRSPASPHIYEYYVGTMPIKARRSITKYLLQDASQDEALRRHRVAFDVPARRTLGPPAPASHIEGGSAQSQHPAPAQMSWGATATPQQNSSNFTIPEGVVPAPPYASWNPWMPMPAYVNPYPSGQQFHVPGHVNMAPVQNLVQSANSRQSHRPPPNLQPMVKQNASPSTGNHSYGYQATSPLVPPNGNPYWCPPSESIICPVPQPATVPSQERNVHFEPPSNQADVKRTVAEITRQLDQLNMMISTNGRADCPPDISAHGNRDGQQIGSGLETSNGGGPGGWTSENSSGDENKGNNQQSNGLNWGDPINDAQKDAGNQNSTNQNNKEQTSWNDDKQSGDSQGDRWDNDNQHGGNGGGDWDNNNTSKRNDNAGNSADSKTKAKKSKKSRKDETADAMSSAPAEPAYTRAYWKSPADCQGNLSANSSKRRDRHVMPEEPIYTISDSKAKEAHVRHQVRPGAGTECVKPTYKPLYWDDLDKPYAVFRFHYRSRGMFQFPLQTIAISCSVIVLR